MALSNWDTLCFNHKGKICSGDFMSPMGVNVVAYKNWLYVRDKKSWRKGTYAEPIVMEVNSGELCYMDINIRCEFQSSIDDISEDYSRILFAIWSGFESSDDFTGIIGVACFADMNKQDIEALQIFLNKADYYVNEGIPERFKNIDLSKGKRYNQGDAYFHDVLGMDRQCTPVGESKDTVFSQIFNSNKDL